MGKRSGVAETEEEVVGLGLEVLNAEIERCLQGAEHGGSSQGRKASFQASCVVGKDERENTQYSSNPPPLA
jgi:hypothetical protein